MPPEQVRESSRASESADTYAVGVTLYYLLTGRYSFDFPTPDELRFRLGRGRPFRDADEAVRAIVRLDRARHPFQVILSQHPVPVLRRTPDLAPRLAAVIDRAVARNPRHRFQTAEEFRIALLAAGHA
jgi:serine/threonine protein kinase